MTQNRFTSTVTTLFRLVVGSLFALHGTIALFGVFGGAMGSGQAVPTGQWPGWWAALIQFVGGILVFAGLGTRVSAVICSGSMAYAYFIVHAPMGLLPTANGGELSALFAWSFLLIAVLGPGPFALDRLFARRAKAETETVAYGKELIST